MQALEAARVGGTLLGILQVGAVVSLALSGALAMWRAVTDYAQGDKRAGVGARH
jgi:hypothetical protein